MKRLHLIEIEDQPWLPNSLRDALTDYLQLMTARTKPYAPILARLENAVEQTKAEQIIDLCSGGAGPWLSLNPAVGMKVLLTDKFTNTPAFQRAKSLSNGAIDYVADSVDATDVPVKLNGFRTLFASFHHFHPAKARAILKDAVEKKQGIGIFEATHRSGLAIALMFLMPLLVLLFTPLIRPFRLSRIVWTYLVPILPLIVLFDGIVSCLRTYNPTELRELTTGLKNYKWEIGELNADRAPYPVTYLIGYPNSE